MSDESAFVLFDCSLSRGATGRSCSNLRELLEAVHTASDRVLEHHMMRCALEDHFELYEFPNDLARWCWDALGDRVLGEQLGLVDPYQFDSIDGVRAALVNAIESQLWEVQRIPWCRPGLELHLVESRLVAYDTGERFTSPAAMAESIPRMTLRSLYFHVHEARRRTGGQSDDFSAWLEAYGNHGPLVESLRRIDFYFLNLKQLRDGIAAAFQQFSSNPSMQVAA